MCKVPQCTLRKGPTKRKILQLIIHLYDVFSIMKEYKITDSKLRILAPGLNKVK